jgi:hypothetical protein
MRVNVKRTALAAVLLAGVATTAYAAGLFQTLPIIGGAAYCAASNVSGAAQTTITGAGGGVAAAGQTTGTVICQSNAPAGPATFSGTEVIPADLYPPGTAQTAGGAQTALVNINQLGQGSIFDNVSASTALTIPNGVQFFILDTGSAASGLTVTMPALGIEGQEVHIVCFVAQTATFAVAPNNTVVAESIKGAAPATCTSGQAFVWRYVASQIPPLPAAAVINANSWVRVQ